jgi:phosphatidylinositol alpha-1,6-mannosyltransferase
MEDGLRRSAVARGLPVRFAVDVPWDDLPGCYAEMDVFCMPCRTRWAGLEIEGLGLVFLEAAATGLPVLAGDSGGAPETVIPGVTGYVVHSERDIVQAVELLLERPGAIEEMGAAGRRRVESEFTWDQVAARFVEGFAAAG